MWIVTAKCLEMIGGQMCLYSVAEIGQGRGWLHIKRQAFPEDGCSNWKRTSAKS